MIDTTQILPSIAPAIMAFIIYVVIRFFPPTSVQGGFFMTTPAWWSRDEKTWATAFKYIAQKYLLYAIILAVFCGALVIFDWPEAFWLGYLLLIIFLGLTHFQVRAYMRKKVQ